MTGYESKKAAARDKLDDDDTQVYQDHDDTLTIAYQSGYYDGKKAAAHEPWRESASDYERGFIDGMQKQAQSSVDKTVNAMAQRPWVGLTVEEIEAIGKLYEEKDRSMQAWGLFACAIEAKLKEKNT